MVAAADYQMNHPTKEQVRAWMKREVAAHRPPPEPEQIRRELGWGMVVGDLKLRECSR